MKKIALLGVCGLASAAVAQGPAVVDYSGGGVFDIYYGGSTGDVIGFGFDADVDMVITDLGVAIDVNDGFVDSPHMIGIWDYDSLDLLGSVEVDFDGTQVGDFLYMSVTPIELTAGQRYVAGAMYASGDGDAYTSGPSSITLDGISNTTGHYPEFGDIGFEFPLLESGGNAGRLGPNFIWEEPGGGCAADLDGDNDADADDFFAYLDAFAGGNTDVCDIDGDGDCDADDFFGYLDLFARGC